MLIIILTLIGLPFIGFPFSNWSFASSLDYVIFTFLSFYLVPTINTVRGKTTTVKFILESSYIIVICPLFWTAARAVGIESDYAWIVAVTISQTSVYYCLQSRSTDRVKYPTVVESLLISILLILLTVTITNIFSNFSFDNGAQTGFPYLVVTDFFHHRTVVTELLKNFPPLNPYFYPEKLHYYWLAHTIPASFSDLTNSMTSADTALQMSCLTYASLITLNLFYVVKKIANFRISIALTFICIFFSGYIWIISLIKFALGAFAEYANSPIILHYLLTEQGADYSGMSHGLLRDFVTEPQGCLGFLVLLSLVLLAYSPELKLRRMMLSLILGTSFGIDPFLGLIICTGHALTELLHLTRANSFQKIGSLLMTFTPALLPVALFSYLEMTGGNGGRNIHLHPYWKMLFMFPVVAIAEYGPLAIAPFFSVKDIKTHLRTQPIILTLLCATLPIMLLVRHEFVHTLVFRKSLRIIRYILFFFTGLSLTNRLRDVSTHKTKLFIALLFFLTIPSLITDYLILTTADGTGRSIVISNDDIKACRWIRDNTPLSAVVQGRPDYGDKSNFTPQIVFGERWTALGDFIRARNYQIGVEGPIARSKLLRTIIFGPGSIDETLAAIKQLRIDYIYVGDTEISYYGETTLKFHYYPDHFNTVYQNDSVRIFKVMNPGHVASKDSRLL